MFAGLWDPPYLEGHQEVEGFLEVGVVEHALSHRKITVRVLLNSSSATHQGTDVEAVALSTMDMNVLRCANEKNER